MDLTQIGRHYRPFRSNGFDRFHGAVETGFRRPHRMHDDRYALNESARPG